MLRKVRMTHDRFSIEKIYMSFIRPILEYADVIWDSQNQSLINKLENVQLDAARIVTEGAKLTGLNRLYEETKWEKLSDRRQNHKLILFHKIKNNRTPQYLLDLIPNSVGSRYNHNTRQVNNMLEINTRTNQYTDYFLPSTIKLWNNLPLTLRKTESLSILKKKKIKNQNAKVPTYYYIGSRIGHTLHARLRMNSSSLNEHLFLRNLVDSPICLCGGWGWGVETTSHYILHCSRFADIRQEFILSISNILVNITINLLLFGTKELMDEQNTLIFVSIQKYIIKSKRFTP